MSKSRVEAFSDGVIAILITIMVLELRSPEGTDWQSLHALWPTLLTYVLSFIYLGIYWNNHHHLFQAVTTVSGAAMWANLHLLFWLSLIPFLTEWMGEHHFATLPTAVYGVGLLACAIAYFLLQRLLIARSDFDHTLRRAIGRDMKGKASPICYLVALPLAYVSVWIALAIYLAVALMWIIPDRRIERALAETATS